MIISLLYSIVFGLVVGLIWSFSLSISITKGLLWGVAAFAAIWVAMSFLGKAARTGGNVTKGESSFVSSTFLTMFGIILTALGLVVWAIRAFL